MANRKQFLSSSEDDRELMEILAEAKGREVSDETLHEQRVSFAFGNAMNSEKITKETVRKSSLSIRIRA